MAYTVIKKVLPVLKDKHGFTLVEMVVTIAVIGILAACSLPFVLQWREKTRYVGTMQTLVTSLHKSKMVAIRENNSVDVEIKENSYLMYIEDEDNNIDVISQEELPEGYRIPSPPDPFEFSPRGTIPAFTSEQNIQVIASNGKTGVISINMIGRITHTF